jgi:hypothetical protein
MFWLDTSPAYFRYYAGTIRLEEKQADEVTGHKLDLTTGMFVPAAPDEVRTVLAASDSEHFAQLTHSEFVFATEDARRRHLHGEGSVFPIYELIDAMHRQAEEDGREITDAQSAFIVALHIQTFAAWEKELASQAAGQAASFVCGPKGSPQP